MRILSLSCIFFLFFISYSHANDSNSYKLTELRHKYLEASKDSEAGKAFNKLMSAYKGKDPVVVAYRAASEATMAKYVWNPYSKMKHLKTSAELFEKAVSMNSSDPEIRFLRFTVEHYVPRYLKMSENIQSDKKIIIRSLETYPQSGISEEWARTMRDFMLTKDHCTEEEKKVLRNVKI